MNVPLKSLQRDDEAYRALFGAETATFTFAQGIEECNDAACRLLGRTRDEMIGRAPLDLAPPVQPDGTLSADGGSLRVASALAGRPQWFQWQFLRADGEPITTLVHMEAVQLDSTVRLLVQVRDLTQLWRAENSLRQTETRLQQVLDGASAIVFVKDREGRYLFVNREYERLAGTPRSRILGRVDADFYPPETVARLRANDARVFAENRSLEFEEVVTFGGVPKTYVAVKFPLARPDGMPYAVCGIATDITERKRSEDALRRAALAVSSAGGGDVFGVLVRDLATILEVDAAVISVFVDDARSRMRTLAAWLDGRPLRSFEYELASTPCAGVVGREFRYSPSGMRQEFAPGTMFAAKGFDSYTAYSLSSSTGKQLGLIAAMHRRTLGGEELAEATLKIFAMRVSAELERAHAAEALVTSEASYRAIFEASEDAIFVHDWDTGAILDASPKAGELYGYTREEMRRINVGDVSANEHPYTQAEAAKLIQQAKNGGPLRFEWHARRKSGELRWHEVTLKPARIAGEARVLAFTRDITERKLADQALRASEEQYRAIFNAAADGFVLRDADFRIVDVNPAYIGMSGYTREEVLGVDRVVTSPPETNAAIKAQHRRALAGEHSIFEIDARNKDGSRSEVEIRAVPIQYRGRPHVLYIGRDISARKRAEAERAALEAQLRQAQKMEAIGHLAGGIAHDFNNILTSVMGYVVLASEREAARGDAKLPQYLDQARLSCERARDLIQQMLTFSRGRQGEPRLVKLPRIVNEATSLLRPSLPATIELATALEPDLPPAMLDPVQAEQVLLNLCINARDAMDGQGQLVVGARRYRAANGAVCASCRGRVAGEFVALEVTDTGPGIPADVMERMFEPFYSTKEVGKGSGMGLSMTHGIVHEHGGHILVDTADGKGTTFRVLFPLQAADDMGTLPPQARGASAGAPRVALSGRVLVIDDEESVAGFMRELLESWGLEVTALTDPTAAREMFACGPERYDLVITDQTMPRLTGLQLARELLRARPSLPLILYTGYADELTETEAKAAGVRALLRKPVEPRDLLALLRVHLPRSEHALR